MLKTEDDFKQRYVSGCVRAFLESKQNIDWVMAVVRGHRLSRQILEAILTCAQPGNDLARYEKLLSRCRDQGLL